MSAHIHYHPHFSPYAGGRALVAAVLAFGLVILILAIGTSLVHGG